GSRDGRTGRAHRAGGPRGPRGRVRRPSAAPDRTAVFPDLVATAEAAADHRPRRRLRRRRPRTADPPGTGRRRDGRGERCRDHCRGARVLLGAARVRDPERSGADAGARWDVDQLPEPQSTGVGRVDAIASVIFGILAVAVILWDQLRGFVRIDGESLPILHPQLWPWWLLGLITLIVAEVALAIVASARKRWTTGSAVINTGLAVVFLSWALMLLGRGRLLNPDFLDAVFLDTGVGPDTMRILGIVLAFGIVGVSLWDIIDGWLRVRRGARR